MADNNRGQGKENQSSHNRGLANADQRTREEVARKGGEAVSRNKEHMAEIGKKGGEHSHGGGRHEGGNKDRNR